MQAIWIPTFLVGGWVLLATGVAAQDGCTVESPCPWVLDLDEGGFVDHEGIDESPLRTVGDVFYLDVFNGDSVAHTLRVLGSSPAVELVVPPYDQAGSVGTQSAAFRFDAAGDYAIEDVTAGVQLPVTVIDEDTTTVEEVASDPEGGGKGSPGVGLGLTLVALAVLALRRR